MNIQAAAPATQLFHPLPAVIVRRTGSCHTGLRAYLQQCVAVAVGEVVLQTGKSSFVVVGEVKLLKAQAALGADHQTLVAGWQQRPTYRQAVLQKAIQCSTTTAIQCSTTTDRPGWFHSARSRCLAMLQEPRKGMDSVKD